MGFAEQLRTDGRTMYGYGMTSTTTETSVTQAPATTETPSDTVETKESKRDNTNAIAARQRNARYRQAGQAIELLESLGFKVEAPEGWESPERLKAREAYERAVAELRKLGIPVPSFEEAEASNGNGGAQTVEDEPAPTKPAPTKAAPAAPPRASRPSAKK